MSKREFWRTVAFCGLIAASLISSCSINSLSEASKLNSKAIIELDERLDQLESRSTPDA